MPKAGKKRFPYTKAGKKRAQKYAKKHGLKVKGSKNPGHYAEGTIMNKEELAGESVWNTYKNIAHIFLGETVIPKTTSKKPIKVRAGARTSQRGGLGAGRSTSDSDETKPATKPATEPPTSPSGKVMIKGGGPTTKPSPSGKVFSRKRP